LHLSSSRVSSDLRVLALTPSGSRHLPRQMVTLSEGKLLYEMPGSRGTHKSDWTQP
jgi:hypothetical protein